MADQDGAPARMTTGDLAAVTGLSLRSIRWYEEVGLVPAERSPGGHRLYDQAGLARLRLIMQMKPLDFSLDEMRSLLDALDTTRDDGAAPAQRGAAREQLAAFADLVDRRWQWLQERVEIAEQFRDALHRELDAGEPSRRARRPARRRGD